MEGPAPLGARPAAVTVPPPLVATPVPPDLRPVDPAWCLVVDEGEMASRVAESLLSVADGVVGTRGCLEEAGDEACVAVAGLFEPAPGVGERMVSVPSWCAVGVAAGLPEGRRVLDLRDGVVTRQVVTAAGTLRTVRFACAARPGTGVEVAEAEAGLLGGMPAGTSVGVTRGPVAGGAAPGGVVVATFTRSTGLARPGGRVVVERIAVHDADGRRVPAGSGAARRLGDAMSAGPSRLLAEQRAAWARRWEAADVEVVGDPEATRAVRLALFHLLSSVRRDDEAAVGARGLTGPAYAGHVLWDTEAFVLPVLAAVDLPAARAVLEYRRRRLAPARERAAAEGRRGARFPWESASDGRDVTPRSGIDHDGRTVAIETGQLEEHVTADIAWAAWRYAAWRGSWSFLCGPGRPLVLDAARYFESRLRWEGSRAHIDGVIGPDEYHVGVRDDAFTNVMARWTLRRAAELAARVGGAVLEEAAGWRRAAAAIVDGYDPTTRRIEQFAGYDRLDPGTLADHGLGRPPVAADLVLGEKLARTQIVKQADVLMAYLLVPDELPPGSLEVNLDYYLPRTAHGSSLSPSVHAALLARAGRADEALELLRLAASIDLEDLTETTAGGLHLANLGGIWQALVHGFAGLSVRGPDDDELVLAPRLPASWEELRVRLRWHGRLVRLRCRPDGTVHVGYEAPLAVSVHGQRRTVEPPGGWVGD